VAGPVASDPRRYAFVVLTVSSQRFEELVNDALAELPPQFAQAMENVAVIVEDHAEGRNLFGLYEGIPLTRRGPMSYGGVMPDRITLYQDTISAHCNSEAELIAQIRKTVIHEVAHHFGIGDPRLNELGWG
jgi:predicted Zn-dependent protease with MMP-like domain